MDKDQLAAVIADELGNPEYGTTHDPGLAGRRLADRLAPLLRKQGWKCPVAETPENISSGRISFVKWDDTWWHRNSRAGEYDGYETIRPEPYRRLRCDDLARAVAHPEMADEVRKLSWPSG